MAKRRWTIDELKTISDKDFILALLNERKNECTNQYAPLAMRLTAVIARVEALKIVNDVFEDNIKVLCHDVSFWFKGEYEITDELKDLLREAAEERARECIAEGYNSGELNYEDDEVSFRGWWRIV